MRATYCDVHISSSGIAHLTSQAHAALLRILPCLLLRPHTRTRTMLEGEPRVYLPVLSTLPPHVGAATRLAPQYVCLAGRPVTPQPLQPCRAAVRYYGSS